MIKKVIIAILFLNLGMSCCAQSQFAPTLSRIEKSLFGIDYSSQSDEVRLQRVEEMVYGQASTADINRRVNKLSKDLLSDTIGQEIKPKRDTFEDEDQRPKTPEPKEDANVNYPIVDQMENAVFNKKSNGAPIGKRLAMLEQKVFSRVYNDDLNSRVERLKSALKTSQSIQEPEDDYSYNSSDLLSDYSSNPNYPPGEAPQEIQPPVSQDYQSYNSNDSVLDSYAGDYSLGVPLAALEKSILRKTYPDDNLENRLSRLEGRVFNSDFSEDDPKTRLDRIASANQAKKSSSKYDNNKFSQHVSTAMQIGAMLLMVLAFVL